MGEPIAEKKWTSAQKQEIENSRINTTKFMMKTLKNFKINPKVIINGSAIGYYGTSLSSEFNENSPGGKDFLSCLLYTSPSPRDSLSSRMPSSA